MPSPQEASPPDPTPGPPAGSPQGAPVGPLVGLSGARVGGWVKSYADVVWSGFLQGDIWIAAYMEFCSWKVVFRGMQIKMGWGHVGFKDNSGGEIM